MRDGLGRQVDYLRVSITDRCNERCAYCMPEHFSDWLPRTEILSYEEILRVCRVAGKLGVSRYRITGGEPLVRREVEHFVAELAKQAGVKTVAMTTNGTRLAALAGPLRRAGLSSLNISLDALDPAKYHEITRGRLDEALAGIDAAIDAGFEKIKLNTVLIRGMNEDQLWPIVEYAAAHRGRKIVVRFIELMPVTSLEMIGEERFLSTAAAREIISRHDELTPLPDAKHGSGPARYWRLKRLGIDVGFISAMSDEHFCETCNKMRLTADGFIRPCLGNHGEHDLKPALRNVGGNTDEAVERVFRAALAEKPAEHIFRTSYTPLRIMTAIGG